MRYTSYNVNYILLQNKIAELKLINYKKNVLNLFRIKDVNFDTFYFHYKSTVWFNNESCFLLSLLLCQLPNNIPVWCLSTGYYIIFTCKLWFCIIYIKSTYMQWVLMIRTSILQTTWSYKQNCLKLKYLSSSVKLIFKLNL